MQFRAARQVVEFQDLAEKQVIALGDSGIGLPFDGIDEGDAVPAVQRTGQGEAVFLSGFAGKELASLDLERGIRNLAHFVPFDQRFGVASALGEGVVHGHPVKAG